jgi:hypothetical protein
MASRSVTSWFFELINPPKTISPPIRSTPNTINAIFIYFSSNAHNAHGVLCLSDPRAAP